MSKIADTEANATSLDSLVNDNALVTTLRNGPKPSYQYLVDGWNTEFDALIDNLEVQGDNAIALINADVATVEAAKNSAISSIDSDLSAFDAYYQSAKDTIGDDVAEFTIDSDAALAEFEVESSSSLSEFAVDSDAAIAEFELNSSNSLSEFAQESAEAFNEFDLTLDQYKESRGFNTKGTFADGFTYELPNDVGLDANGNPWILIDTSSLPVIVSAGTTPSNPPYKQVAYGTASQVSTNTSDTVQSFADSFALKIFQSPTDGGLTEIQTRTVEANEVYEVRRLSDDSLVTIYSDAGGANEIEQNGTSNISDSAGVVEFYVNNGKYYIEVDGVKSNFSAALKSKLDDVNEMLLLELSEDDIGKVYTTNAFNLANQAGWPATSRGLLGGAEYIAISVSDADSAGVTYWTSGALEGHYAFKVGDFVLVLKPAFDTISPEQLGALGDGVTDDYLPIYNAIHCKRFFDNPFSCGYTVQLRPVGYYLSETLQIKISTQLQGVGRCDVPSKVSSRLVFRDGIAGIIVHRQDTIGDTTVSPSTNSGEGSVIKDLILNGGYSETTEFDGHGLIVRGKCTVSGLNIAKFTGDGYHNRAAASSSNPKNVGNTNYSKVYGMLTTQNGGWGFYVWGPDANACEFNGINATNNGLGGVNDSSFLGNTYSGCHVAFNGRYDSGYNVEKELVSTVHHDGYFWYALYPATDQELKDNEPESGSSYWKEISASVNAVPDKFPSWDALDTRTYFSSNSYLSTGDSSRNVFLGCYAEPGVAQNWLGQYTIAIGGQFGTVNSGLYIGSSGNELSVNRPVNATTYRFGYGGEDIGHQFPSSLGDSTIWSFERDTGRWGYKYRGGANPQKIMFLDENATIANGYERDYSGGEIGIGGYYFGASGEARLRTIRNSAPTSGYARQGDTWEKQNTTSGSIVGWKCTTTGDIGSTAVIKTFGVIN